MAKQAYKIIDNHQLTKICEALRDIGFRQTDADIKSDVKKIWLEHQLYSAHAPGKDIDHCVTIIIWFDCETQGIVWDYDDETSAKLAKEFEVHVSIEKIFNQ